MPTWVAKVACTVPGGRFYAAGDTCVADKSPCKHFEEVKSAPAVKAGKPTASGDAGKPTKEASLLD